MQCGLSRRITHLPRIQSAAAAAAGCFVIAACLVGSGCGQPEGLDPEIEKLGRATGPVSERPVREPAPAPTDMPRGAVHRGEVVETIQVPNYTYIRLSSADSGTRWTAVPSTDKVRVGQTVGVVESIVMKDFTSRSLGRTFPTIVFGILDEGGGDRVETEAQKAPTDAPPSLPSGHPPVGNSD